MSGVARIRVFIMCEESLSLFPGATHAPRFGGAGLQMYLLGLGLAGCPEFDVTFVFNGPLGNAHSNQVKLTRQRIIRRGLPLVSRYLNRRSRISTYRGSGPCVLISTTAGMAPRLVADGRLADAKTVFRVASDADVTYPLQADETRRQQVFESLQAVDRVVVQTGWQKDALLQNTGVESEVIRKALPVPARPPQGQKSGALWVGSCQPLKQPWHFVDLAQAFPDQQFTMILPPADQQLHEYVIRRARALPNLNLIPRQISFEEVQSHFDAARVFVYTSEFSTHPENTVLQACIGACAILSLRLDPDEMFTSRNAGMRVDDCAELQEGFRRLSQDEPLCRELGNAAFDYAATDYDLKRMVAEYESLIKGLF